MSLGEPGIMGLPHVSPGSDVLVAGRTSPNVGNREYGLDQQVERLRR